MPKTKKSVITKKKPATKTSARSARTNVSKSKTTKQRKGIINHSKRLYLATPKFIHGMVVGAFVGIIIVSQLGTTHNTSALAITAGHDCDSYSIINCGVTSTNDLKNNYDNSAYIRHVYQHFGISGVDMDNIGATAVQGTVFRNGDVKVNGKVVATDSITAARLQVTNRDRQVVVSGSTFFTRTLSTSWSHDSAQAYIVMKDGVFQFAILAPCGNPIIATPVRPTPPPPAPTPPPAPAPSLACVSLGSNSNGLTYTFVAKASVKNTTIKSYSFYLSDRSSPVVVRTSATKASIQHKFAQYSTKYSAYVIVSSGKLTTQKSAACSRAIITPTISECKPGVPVGSAECTECDSTNDAGNNACAPPTTVVEAASVSTLANTGPGAILIIFASALVGGTLFHKTHHHIKKRRHAKRHTTAHHAH